MLGRRGLGLCVALVASLLLVYQCTPLRMNPVLYVRSAAAAQTVPHSLALNGSTAFAEVANTPDLNLTVDWTIELWFKDVRPEGYLHLSRVLLTKGDPLADQQAA